MARRGVQPAVSGGARKPPFARLCPSEGLHQCKRERRHSPGQQEWAPLRPSPWLRDHGVLEINKVNVRRESSRSSVRWNAPGRWAGIRSKRGRQWNQGQELAVLTARPVLRGHLEVREDAKNFHQAACAVLISTGQCPSSHGFRECTFNSKRPFCYYRRAGTLPVSPLGPEEHLTNTP